MKRSIRLAYFTVAMLAFTGASHADDIAASTRVSLDGLRYTLIDLAPDDGVAANMSINGQWAGSQEVIPPGGYFPDLEPVFSGEPNGLFGTGATVTRPSPDGSVSYVMGANQASLTSMLAAKPANTDNITSQDYTYETQDETGQWHRVTVHSTSGYIPTTRDAAGGSLNSGVYVDGLPVPTRITLTPHTLLIVEGTANLSMSADRSSLVGKAASFQALLGDGVEYQSVYGDGRLYTDATVSLSRSYFGSYGQIDDTYQGGVDGGAFMNFTGEMRYDFAGFTDTSGIVIDDALTRTRDLSRGVALTYANVSDDAQDLGLAISLRSSIIENFSASGSSQRLVSMVPIDGPSIPDPVTIPEPGTYALMGLGLAGLALVRRRRG